MARLWKMNASKVGDSEDRGRDQSGAIRDVCIEQGESGWRGDNGPAPALCPALQEHEVPISPLIRLI